jgi:hypothetical protein
VKCSGKGKLPPVARKETHFAILRIPIPLSAMLKASIFAIFTHSFTISLPKSVPVITTWLIFGDKTEKR